MFGSDKALDEGPDQCANLIDFYIGQGVRPHGVAADLE